MNPHCSAANEQPTLLHNHARYDAEHHLMQVDGSEGWCQSDTGTAATACYTYDAEGRRVRRSIPGSGITDDYLYDLSGHFITQVSSSGFWVRDEIYANGTHIATYENDLQTPTTFFTHGDHLGTERVETAVNGSSCETITNTAFGDGLNTSGSCDPTELRFTSQPRDWETNLDYFGARFYSSQFGRFNSTDPENAGASDDDPQSWNGYSYVRGSVLNATDPGGLDCIYINNDTGQYEGFNTGDCDNSTSEKANSGYYVNGAVNTIYTTTGDTSGVVTGFDATNDSGATIVGAFVPDTNSDNNSDLLNAVARGTQMSEPIVKPAFWATMGFLGTFGPGILESSLALPSAGLTIPGGGLVIGKMRDLGDLAAGERTLSDRGQMPSQGSYQGNAVQNASRLRFEMSRGEPIRDASAGNYDETNFGFLKLERNILLDHGWKLSSDGYWYPPNK